MANVLVVGSINFDCVMNVKEFVQKGETIEATDYHEYPGGKGANQAIALEKSGVDTTFICAVGKDANGDYLSSVLENAGLDTRHVLKKDCVTGSAFIQVNEKGQNSIVIVHGANYQLSKEDLQNKEELFAQADAILTQLEVTDEVIETCVELAEKYNKPLFLNPAPVRKLGEHILKRTFMITPNESELGVLSGSSCESMEEMERAVRELSRTMHTNILVTLGSAGCLYKDSSSEEMIYVDSFRVDAVDTTAAGDCFNGAFISAYLKYGDVKKAMIYANAFAALSVKRQGAISSIPGKEDVEIFLKEQQICLDEQGEVTRENNIWEGENG